MRLTFLQIFLRLAPRPTSSRASDQSKSSSHASGPGCSTAKSGGTREAPPLTPLGPFFDGRVVGEHRFSQGSSLWASDRLIVESRSPMSLGEKNEYG